MSVSLYPSSTTYYSTYQGVRERKILLRALLDTFIEDPNSYLFGLSGPQSLDSYRLETSSRLRVNQALSPAGYDPNHDELWKEKKNPCPREGMFRGSFARARGRDEG
jgi:hypothetical protein